MTARTFATFFVQCLTVGLAVAFVVVLLNPDLIAHQARPVVELNQGASDVRPTGEDFAVAPGGDKASYADAVRRAAPTVVSIHPAQAANGAPDSDALFHEGPPAAPRDQEDSLGSGVIVSPQGYILTNHHVIQKADRLSVTLHDGRRAPAEIVGADPETDLAVLHVELDDVPSITIAGSDNMEVGDVVLAIGNPFSVGQTVTLGIISATGRQQLGITTFEDFIQTDAAINPGNSGGALVNPSGELVGINTAIFSRTGGFQGIGFAIPVSIAQNVTRQIIEQGVVVRGWLGVEIQNVSHDLAEALELKRDEGVLVTHVLPDGPAERAGLESGDVLLSIDGERVTSVRGALDSISQRDPDSEIRIEGLRGGDAFDLTARISQRPVQLVR